METPPQVEFQGMEPIPKSQARVLERIAHIEERYGRITAFRVVVKELSIPSTGRAATTRSTSMWHCRTGGKSRSRGRRQRTSAFSTSTSRLTTHSSARGGGYRIRSGACAGR